MFKIELISIDLETNIMAFHTNWHRIYANKDVNPGFRNLQCETPSYEYLDNPGKLWAMWNMKQDSRMTQG